MTRSPIRMLGRLAASMALATGVAAAAALVHHDKARAGEFPEQPIQMIVPYKAGGGTDTMARVLAAAMTRELGQPVVVVNHAGGGGAVGGSVLANSTPDGYTILLGGDDIPSYIPHASAVDFSFASFQAIAAVAEYQNAMVARADAPFTTFEEFVAYAKANPGIRLGHIGGITQLFMERLVRESGIDARVITTGGGSEVLQFLLAGEIDAGYSGGVHNQSPEQWVVLGSFNESRLASAPDKPTFEEAGFGISMPSKLILLAPAGVPAEIAAKIEAAAIAAAADPDFVTIVQDRLQAPVSVMDGAALNAYLAELGANLGALVE